MKFAFKSLNSLVLAGLLTGVGASAAMAQAPATEPAAPASAALAGERSGHHRMAHRDPAKRQALMARRQAEMKAELKLDASQESAWTRYVAAMQSPARMMGARPTAGQRAEFNQLTTPERIDKMRAMRIQRMADVTAAMDQRGEAAKALYAALSPEQQKTFDTGHQRAGNREGRGHHANNMPYKG